MKGKQPPGSLQALWLLGATLAMLLGFGLSYGGVPYTRRSATIITWLGLPGWMNSVAFVIGIAGFVAALAYGYVQSRTGEGQ